MNNDRHARTMLPIPDRPAPGLTTYDAKDPDTTFPPIEPLLPPEGAPNVLIVLIDDTGFGASSAFGGPCHTPNAEKLAAGGLKYNRFHTTALCAPTRAAMLSGRNHHSVGMGSVTETATSAPGNSSLRPNTKVGYESGTAVSADYIPRNSRFTGTINWVQIDLGIDDHDHLINPQERLRITMARQ